MKGVLSCDPLYCFRESRSYVAPQKTFNLEKLSFSMYLPYCKETCLGIFLLSLTRFLFIRIDDKDIKNDKLNPEFQNIGSKSTVKFPKWESTHDFVVYSTFSNFTIKEEYIKKTSILYNYLTCYLTDPCYKCGTNSKLFSIAMDRSLEYSLQSQSVLNNW
ncbi:unnamed protein product [Rhizophagus irregularis]|nr:unnamed protein product [Rhizophagus irregularis]CAB5359256.1 unnamed protein product [Rhizophagus irregularis]